MAQETRDSGTVRRRWWWRPRLLGVLIVGLGCFWWVWDSKPRISLPTGAVVVVDRLSYGTEHKPEQTFLRRLSARWRGDPGGLQSMGTEWNSIGIWLTCRTAWTHRPQKFDGVGNVILIDRDGWPYSGSALEEMERTWDGAYVSTGNPVNIATLRRGSDVASVVWRPVVRPRGSDLTVGMVDAEGRLLGMTDVAFPAPIPPESDWSPEELPATRSIDALSVTLLGVEFRKPEPNPALQKPMPGLPPGILVKPQFEVRWKGKPCTDCWLQTWDGYLGSLRTQLSTEGNRISARDPCRWSPFEPAWEWRHHFFPGPSVEFDAEDIWDAGDVPIPAAGELVSLARRGLIREGEYGVEYAGGPGRHELSIEIGRQIELHARHANDGRYHVTGRRMGNGSTQGTYDIETEVPFLVISSPAYVTNRGDPSQTTPSFHTLIENAVTGRLPLNTETLSTGQWSDDMKGGIDHPREYRIVFLPAELRDVQSVQLTLAEYRFHEFKFLIRPPSLDVYEKLNLLPETVSARQTTRD